MTETQVKSSDKNAGTGHIRNTGARAVQPPVDIIEDANGITLWVDLPGVPKEKLDLQVHDANLLIDAEAKIASDENLTLQHAELQSPRFSRAFTLSSDFDTEKIDANLADGVLRVTIPRHEKSRPRRIEVQVS